MKSTGTYRETLKDTDDQLRFTGSSCEPEFSWYCLFIYQWRKNRLDSEMGMLFQEKERNGTGAPNMSIDRHSLVSRSTWCWLRYPPRNGLVRSTSFVWPIGWCFRTGLHGLQESMMFSWSGGDYHDRHPQTLISRRFCILYACVYGLTLVMI